MIASATPGRPAGETAHDRLSVLNRLEYLNSFEKENRFPLVERQGA